MFCPQCGSNIGDNSKFCSVCGCNLNGGVNKRINNTPNYGNNGNYGNNRNSANQPYPNQPAGPQGGRMPRAKKKSKLPLIIGIVAAAVAVIAIVIAVVFFVIRGRSTPEKTIAQLEKAMNSFDTEAMIECFDSESREQLSGSQSELASSFNQMKAFVKDDADIFKLSGSNYNYYEQDGKEYCSCDVAMSYSMLGQSASENQTFVLVKEDGKWLITNENANNILSF